MWTLFGIEEKQFESYIQVRVQSIFLIFINTIIKET